MPKAALYSRTVDLNVVVCFVPTNVCGGFVFYHIYF